MKSFVVLIALVRTAAAGSDQIAIEGDVGAGLYVRAGGSLAFVHRFDASLNSLVLRGDLAAVNASSYDIVDANDTFVAGLVGIRHQWEVSYGEIDFGVGALTKDHVALPDLEVVFGGMVGPVDLGLWANVPFLSAGIRIGIALELGS
ncbi:MAG: hypothetical protein QM831_03930 [Kofleriaceae bacterium]